MQIEDQAGRQHSGAFLALCAAFFLSGFAALIDQIVWQRMLGLFAGSDAVTAALVVGAFLLGLGLGSLAAGAITDRLGTNAALLGFVLCELAIGIFALLSRPFLYDFVVQVVGPMVANRWGIFAVCFAGILAPTMLMGASLPLLAKAAVRSIDDAAMRIGWLYGLNTLGAGLGALLGGWWLIGTFGYEGSLQAAAVLNLTAAAIGFILWRRGGDSPVQRQARAGTSVKPASGFGFVTWAVLVFVSGFAIVALEILWVRVAGVIAQYTAYSFATILGTFLLADGVGMVIGALWVRRLQDTRGAFFTVQALATLYALASIYGVYWLAGADWWDGLLAAESTRHYGLPLMAALGVTIALVAPPSLLLGISFPLAQQAVQTDLSQLGWRVAAVQVANIVGNAAGSLATGLVALHWLGTAGTLKLIALLAIALLVYWTVAAWRERQLASWRIATGLSAALLAALLLFPANAQFWARLHQAADHHEILVAEDRSGLALFRLENNAGNAASPFFIQGFTQSKWPFLLEHAFLGAVGPLLHPAPKDVLVIGSGSGGTPFAAGVNPATTHVRVVELVGPVFQVLRDFAARQPQSAIAALLSDPRYEFVIGDGRRAIFATDRRYDVIQADAILPESSHSGLLYSIEFMKLVLAALDDDGIYVQWGPTARSVATFSSVFPHVMMLQPFPVLIGSRQPVQLDHARLQALFMQESTRRHFETAGIDTLQAGRLFRDAIRQVDRTDDTVGINADLFPRDEYYFNNRLQAATKKTGM